MALLIDDPDESSAGRLREMVFVAFEFSVLCIALVLGIVSWFERKPLGCLACLNSSKVDVRETGFGSSKAALWENGQGSRVQEDDSGHNRDEKRRLGANIVDTEHVGCKSLRQKYRPRPPYF